MTRIVLGVVSLALLGVTAWFLVRGIEVTTSTGGLLLAPVRLVRLHGGWLLGATVTAVAAVLVGVRALAGLVGRPGSVGRTGVTRRLGMGRRAGAGSPDPS